MNKHFCKYHPLSPALWWSDELQVGYCERCVDYSGSKAGSHQAKNLLSGGAVQYMGSAHSAVPFWERLPEFFKYPTHGNSILFLASVILIGSILSSLGGLLAVVGVIVSLAAITKYGFLAITKTAQGDFNPPSWNEAFSGDISLFVKQIGVQVIFGLFLTAVAWLGIKSISLLTSLIVVFVMPASLIIFAMEEDIGHAVSPKYLFDFIARIGGAYFILYLFLSMLSLGHVGVFSMLRSELPDTWFVPIFICVTLYFMLVMYHLMGYVVFQYQSELGLVSEDEKTAQRRQKFIDFYNARVDVLIKEGHYHEAVIVFKKALGQKPNDFQKHDKLSKLLVAIGDKEAALAHGNQYLTRLHQVGDDARLYLVFSYYQQVDENFLPKDPGVRIVLAEQFHSRGKYDFVIKLLANMHKQYPNFDDIPGAYLMLAKALYHGKGLSEKAKQFLGFVLHYYSDSKQVDEIKALLHEIENASNQ